MGVISKKIICFYCTSIISLSLSGCGGGGGGGGSGGGSNSSAPTQALTYSGNTNSANITSDNTRTLSQNVTGSTDVTVATVVGIVVDQQSTKNSGVVNLSTRLNDRLHRTLDQIASNTSSSTQTVAGLSINTTQSCAISGSISFSGSINDTTGTGALDITFNSCMDNTGWLNGQATYKVDAYNSAYDLDTDATFSFSVLQFKDTGIDVSLSGSMRSEVSIATNKEQITSNFVVKDNLSGKLAKIENLVLVADYASLSNLLNPSSFSLSITSGRIFDSTEGYVDITTTAPWFYATLTQDYPSSGGALVLTGANNVHVTITPLSTTLVKVELDLDANGIYELSSTMPWTILETDKTSNSAPTANAGVNQSIPKSTTVTLDGSGSSDPDYDFLAYQWTLIQKPSGSQSQLGAATTAHPTLKLDLEGSYVISLVVSDGKLNSVASTITITSTNTAPIANAGSDRYATVGAQVTLNASASTDPNGDPISYSWNFSMLPAGSAATLTNPTSAIPAFTPDVGGLYELQLIVSDGKLNSVASAIRIAAESATSSLCTSDDIAGIPATGSLTVGPSQDFIPLCSGWVLIGNRASNAVIYMNAVTGQTNATYSLTSSPSDLELDADNNLLYVALNPTTQLSKINLQTNKISYISLIAPALSIARGNNGQIFTSLDGGVWYNRPIALINGIMETVEKTYPNTNIYSDFVVFDRSRNKLISAVKGMSPSSLYRHAFNPSDLTLTLEENKSNMGTNGQSLAISADGNHLAFPNGGGNGNGYTIYDFNSGSFGSVYGEWNTGPYPSSAEFDPFGRYLVANDYYGIKVFDVATHVLVKQITISLSGCSYSSIEKVGFSRGGKIVYAYTSCGFDKSYGILSWSVFGL